MVKIPTPYDRDDEVPDTLFEFSRGSNNSRRGTVRLQVYGHDEVCLQIEDKLGGGEIWLDEDDLADLCAEMTDALIEVMMRIHGREEIIKMMEQPDGDR